MNVCFGAVHFVRQLSQLGRFLPFDGKRIDVIASLDWQSRLNSYAAFAAGVVAILQSIALVFSCI